VGQFRIPLSDIETHMKENSEYDAWIPLQTNRKKEFVSGEIHLVFKLKKLSRERKSDKDYLVFLNTYQG
jgi:hypothetical protein